MLLSTMDSQLSAVQHRISKVNDKKVKIKQDLATAKQERTGRKTENFLTCF